MTEQKTKPDSMVYLDSGQYGGNDGLTKREYFAAMALQGLLAGNSKEYIEAYEPLSVMFADTLIKELNK